MSPSISFVFALLVPAAALANHDDASSLLQHRGEAAVAEARRHEEESQAAYFSAMGLEARGRDLLEEGRRRADWEQLTDESRAADREVSQSLREQQHAAEEFSLELLVKHHDLQKAVRDLEQKKGELNRMEDLYIAQDEADNGIEAAIAKMHDVELMINDSESLRVPETVAALVAAKASILPVAEAATEASNYGNFVMLQRLNESTVGGRRAIELFEISQSRENVRLESLQRIQRNEDAETVGFGKLESDKDRDDVIRRLTEQTMNEKSEMEKAKERLEMLTSRQQTARADISRTKQAKLHQVKEPSKIIVGLAHRVSALMDDLQGELRKKQERLAKAKQDSTGDETAEAPILRELVDAPDASEMVDTMANIRSEIDTKRAEVDKIRANISETRARMQMLVSEETAKIKNVTEMTNMNKQVFERVVQDSWTGLNPVLDSIEALLQFTKEVDHIVQLALGAKNHKRRVQTVLSEEGVKVKASLEELASADVKLKALISEFELALSNGEASKHAHDDDSEIGRLDEEGGAAGTLIRAVLQAIREKQLKANKLRQEMDAEIKEAHLSEDKVLISAPTKEGRLHLVLLYLRRGRLQRLDVDDQIDKASDDWKSALHEQAQSAEMLSSQADDTSSVISSLREQEKRLAWQIEETHAANSDTVKELMAVRRDREAPKPISYAVVSPQRRSEPANMLDEAMSEEHMDD